MNEKNIYSLLEELGIEYRELKHNAVYTIAEAMAENIPGRIEGVECKNLFLKAGESGHYYLYVLEGEKTADLKSLAKMLNEKKLKFASPEELKKILGLDLGSVTPLGVINDSQNVVTVVFDASLSGRKLLVHPNVNTATISADYEDLIRLIIHTGHSCLIYGGTEL